MIKYINEFGKECYKGVKPSDLLSDYDFHTPDYTFETDISLALHTNLGSLTTVDRMTGFGWRDIESGYRAPNGDFWLASGGYNVVNSGVLTVGEAIAWVKNNSNTCNPDRIEV